MKIKILLTLFIVSILAGCTKDKFQTKPQLSFKKFNTTVLQQRQILVITLQVTDAEGDIQDSIYIEKINPRCPASFIRERHAMPNFTATKNLNAEIEITYAYNNTDPINNGQPYPQLFGPQCNRNDTATFRFWLKDKEKNVSDTLVSDPLVIVR